MTLTKIGVVGLTARIARRVQPLNMPIVCGEGTVLRLGGSAADAMLEYSQASAQEQAREVGP